MSEKCGCRIRLLWVKGEIAKTVIEYCPKHALVDEMVEIMGEIIQTHCSVDGWPGTIDRIKALLDKLGE